MKHTKLSTVQLPALKGTKTIAQATDVFKSYIDPDFKNWNLDKKGEKTEAITLDVMQMREDATFKQLFTNPEKMCLSQEQIIEFCANHKDTLSSWYTFFLFKVDSDFFVAGVDVRPDGLDVYVHEFSHDYVWNAENGYRFVLPQLTLESSDSDSLTLGHSDPSELQKVYIKYRDETTGITAKVFEDTITLKNSKGGFEFVFKNSKKEQVRKVCNSILNFLKD